MGREVVLARAGAPQGISEDSQKGSGMASVSDFSKGLLIWVSWLLGTMIIVIVMAGVL